MAQRLTLPSSCREGGLPHSGANLDRRSRLSGALIGLLVADMSVPEMYDYLGDRVYVALACCWIYVLYRLVPMVTGEPPILAWWNMCR
jgi:hypothetical protein